MATAAARRWLVSLLCVCVAITTGGRPVYQTLQERVNVPSEVWQKLTGVIKAACQHSLQLVDCPELLLKLNQGKIDAVPPGQSTPAQMVGRQFYDLINFRYYEVLKLLPELSVEEAVLEKDLQDLEEKEAALTELLEKLRRGDTSVDIYGTTHYIMPWLKTSTCSPSANRLRAHDCADHLLHGHKQSGVYEIFPFKCKCDKGVKVWCDMETEGGGWTAFLVRQNLTENFERNWQEYAVGFGEASQEYYMGNDNLHAMTSSRLYTMRTVFRSANGLTRWGQWGLFSVASGDERYKLTIGKFLPQSQTADCMAHSNARQFSTIDFDNDGKNGKKCSLNHGAWWYNNCANLAPLAKRNFDGTIPSLCTYVMNGKSLPLTVRFITVMIRPTICDERQSVIAFNTHTCQEHNAMP
ncbi:ficolin-2-like [Homarus americanus]|uniref:ficolin-2-like n=1 Tax=Homarus americanus TaxID=6706 RepID=UPI001C482B59|nr:ficolin-2-like [Homarus americanus]